MPSACVCECARERERERERERSCVRVCVSRGRVDAFQRKENEIACEMECACVCVSERERERETGWVRQGCGPYFFLSLQRTQEHFDTKAASRKGIFLRRREGGAPKIVRKASMSTFVP